MKFASSPLRSALGVCAIALGTLLLAGCKYTYSTINGTPIVTGSGKIATETRTGAAFSKIAIEGSADIDASIGAGTSVAVTCDDNLLPMIETKVEGDTLHIRSTGSYRTNTGLKVKIVSPTLDGVSVSGVASIHASGLAAKMFALTVSGAGHTTLEGKTDQLDVQISGTGDLQAGSLTARDVKISVSGAGNAVVDATQSLDAAVSGVGNVQYCGQPPQVRQNISGVGTVKPL